MIPQVQFDDEAARQRIRTSLDESLIVEASAGTGKTSELVRRIVHVLATGAASIDHIVAVTFTHKAAGELKLRLRQGLDEARASASEAEARNLEDALERLEQASIGTIHSFCAQILRERPVEALVDPAFEEMTEPEAARLYERAFRGWMQHKLSEAAPALRRALTRLAWRDERDDTSPIDRLQYAGRQLIEWRDFPTAWRRDPFDREARIDALVSQAAAVARLSEPCKWERDPLYVTLAPAREFAAWVRRGASDYDALEARLIRLLILLKRKSYNGRGNYAPAVNRGDLISARDALMESIETFRVAADADLAALLRDEMWELVERYNDLKRRSGKLDFTDLLLLTRNLVRDNGEVRSFLQQRFSHLFIDEFQDTDPLQAEILLLLAADDPRQNNWLEAAPVPGKLFVVGDPKQSIYKFRRADIVLYRQIRDRLTVRGAGFVRLTRSFRAVRQIQECVNAAFSAAMTGDESSGQAEYAPLEEHSQAQPGQPCVIALPAPRPFGKNRVSNAAIEKCMPDAIAAFVDWVVNESGWKVRDPAQGGEWVAVSPRHVCLLFRKFAAYGGGDLALDYVRAFDARGIPHLLVGSRSFHHREEVETVRAALAAIEWPDDELSVFAALRGSLFAIEDSLLLRFRGNYRLHPLRDLPEELSEEFVPVRDALAVLANLHRARNRRPIADTLNLLLEHTRAHAGFVLRPSGDQVLANVHRVCELARGFEISGGISFRGFVEELQAQAERGESAESPVVEEGAEGVRLMTVHSAKGLEFPVVILADSTTAIARRDPERHVDAARGLCATSLLGCLPAELVERQAEEHAREVAEGVRIAYVAATRARDLLVLPVVGTEERDSWIAPLNPAVYPPKERYRKPEPASGCPPFGTSSVLTEQECEEVRPGRHKPRQGSHEVIWWCPGNLKLSVEGTFGLRNQEILADGPCEGHAMQERWLAVRREWSARGKSPEFDLFIASEAVEPPPAADPVTIETALRAPRPSGRRFGNLVHAVLNSARSANVALLVEMHGRILGATGEEKTAAESAALAALEHPLIRRAFAARECHREYPVQARLDDGRMLEGIIDLAFLENGLWNIVDFKTDADMEIRLQHYCAQLQWYAAAMRKITGLPSRAWLLNV